MKMKNNPCTVIRFDYGGYYSKNGDDVRWNRKEDQIYTLVMKGSLEEFTYSVLFDRICKKIMLDEATTIMLKLSYIPLLEDPKRQTYIFDDEDVLGYLMEGDKNHRRNVLHVELIEDDRGSGIDVRNNEEIPNEVRVNDDVEQQPPEQYSMFGNVPHISNGENGSCEEIAFVDNYGVDDTPDVQANEVVNLEWEDGIDLTLGQEFESKQAVQDLVEKAVLQNRFEVATFKSSPGLYILKCRDSRCKWYLRVAKLKNKDCFSVRTHKKMHTCSPVTTSTRRFKSLSTPRLVASVLREDFPGECDSPTPKNLIDLVQERFGVKISYSTALRGKKQAASEVRANLHTQGD